MAGDVQIVLGVDTSQVKPGLDSVAGSFQGWAGNTNAVANATQKLEQQLRGFASEQRTQARMSRFYAGEIASIIPAAGGATAALQGLLGIGIEGLAGGLGIGVAFESIKFAVGMASEAMKEHEERLKAVEVAQLAATGAIMAGKYALEELTRGALTDGEKAFRNVFNAATEGIKDFQKEAEKLRPTTWQLVKAFIWDGSAGMRRLQEESAATAATLDRIVASAKQLATEAQRIAELPVFGPGNDVGAGAFAVQSEAAAKAVQRVKELDAAWQKVIADLDVANRKLAAQASPVPEGYGAGAGGAFDVPVIGIERPQSTQMFGPGSDEGAAAFAANLEKINGESAQMKELWGSIGSSVSSAFSSIGDMVGGVAGKIMAWLGQMITQAIQLAIAMSAAGSAWTTPLGSLAIAGTVAAGLLALVSSVSARADGGPVTGMRPYLVGERGPELFVPGTSGGIVPNHAMGGSSVNITFNAPVDRAWWRSQERHVMRTISEAVRAGRTG